MGEIWSKFYNITPKLIAILMVYVLISGALFWKSFNDISDEDLLHESQMNINRLDVLFNTIIDKESEKLSLAIDLIISKKGLIDRFINEDRQDYIEHALPTFNILRDEYEITYFSVHNLNETCFARLHDLARYGDLIISDSLNQARDTMGISIGLELGNSSFSLLATKPFFNGTQHIGYVELGVDIDVLVAEVGDPMGENVIFTIQKSYLDQAKWEQVKNITGERNNWDDMSFNVIVSSTMSQPEVHIDMCFSDDDLVLSHDIAIINMKYSHNNTFYFTGRVPIYNVNGQVIGSLVLIDDITEHQMTHTLEFKQTMLMITIMLLIILLIISVSIHLWVSRPISEIIDKTRRFSKGEMDVQINTKMKGEVGELAHAFDNMTSELKEHRAGLEDTIAKRTQELNTKVEELERYKTLTIDRELRMVELKKEIDELKAGDA